MKLRKMKPLLGSLALFTAVVFSDMAVAHIYSGIMFGNGQIKQTQVLTLNCPASTARVVAEVLDLSANTGIMSVTVFKDGIAQTVSDRGQGDGIYGPDAVLEGGPGTYYLIASQTDKVFGTYRIQYHCEAANGSETTSAPAALTQP